MDRSSKIAVIGTGAAGVAAAETLRLAKFGGQVVMFGDEGHLLRTVPQYVSCPIARTLSCSQWNSHLIREVNDD